MAPRRCFAIAVLAALAATPGIGHAQDNCDVPLDEGSAARPHIADPFNDWRGPVLGNGALGYGDVWREGTDIVAAWLARDPDGNVSATIAVQNLALAQPNTIFYFLWDYEGGDALRHRRFVSARLKGYGEEFTYGYLAPSAATDNAFYTMGVTTGNINPGPLGTVSIDVPRDGMTDPDRNTHAPGAEGQQVSNDAWGAPASGSLLELLVAESRVLIGSPEPLPPPSPVRHGLVGVADSSTDGPYACDASA